MPEGTPDDSDSSAERPEPSDEDVDARWAEITAQLGDLRASAADSRSAGPSASADEVAGSGDPADGTDGAPLKPPTGPRDYESPDDTDEAGFIPPDPPPIQATDPLPTLAWFFALGGPILTVIFLIVWPAAPSWVYLTAILTSVLGWMVLLWRMPRGRREDDDDGAVV